MAKNNLNPNIERLKPYQNWDGTELKSKLKRDISNLRLDKKFEDLWLRLVDDAFDNESWNPTIDYNGCTAVQDYLHPCPACFVHDYMWITGHGGKMSDNIFYHCMRAEGMPANKSKRRWFAVRFMWYVWYMWKYIVRRNWNEPTDSMKSFDKYIRENA